MLKPARIIHYGPWQIPIKGVNILCADGVQRTCRTAMSADTFFTLPARCSVKGKTVSGCITSSSDVEGALIFMAGGKNASVLPDIDYDGWQALVARLRTA